MEYLQIAIKLIVGLSILNVWLVRFNRNTPWRGGSATTMKEEFAHYKLSPTVMIAVGTLKVILAILLIASIWFPILEVPAAMGIAALMLGAILMHIRVSDPIKKSIPAFSFMILALAIILL